MDALSTKKIGKYEITGILGRGGMGVVYRAEDKRIGRQVAIKTLTEGFTGQADMLERFYREAQAGILQHPNIVIVYDLGDEDGVPFIVMEYVNGDPLDKIITSGRPVPLIDKLSIIEQVCAALGYAHQSGVVHRDIKPANVIVQPDGHAKIVDFGIARVQSSNAETGLTRTGNVIGTIHYIAPERLRGQPFDGRSDIFSTGVMLYLLLTGALPFSGEDMTVLQKLVNEAHPPLGNYISNYPPYLDTILDRALAKDPEQRYSTAEEFGADLRAVIDDLKQSRVTELFNDAERLTAEQQFARAREVLQQLIKIDAQHTGAKQLLGIVQQNIARMQRAEQVRQLLAQADEALASSRFPEAIASLEQAVKLDSSNADLQSKLEGAKEKKRREDEIGGLLAEADVSRNRGDLTGALKILEKALHLDQSNTKIRAVYTEYAKQAKLAAQQGQIRELLQNARLEVSSRRFTAAIEILREVSKLDPSHPEVESLLQTAVSGQEQERRRKLLEQVQAQVEHCLLSDDYDRATELVNRAVDQVPTEPSLLQLKTRVAAQARKFRVKQLIDVTAAKAQEAFAKSPHEALGIVQRALQELPGEERLLALEDSLRQRLKSLQAEEVRGRYLREAQEAIDRHEFEKAIGILESYQLEFSDNAGVNELLDFARSEFGQQQRQARIASCATQAKSLIEDDRITDAVRLLEPVATETGDASLSRLLTEARGQQAEAARRLELLTNRVAKLREGGQLDEAIKLLEATPAAAAKGTLLNAMLAELRTENARQQAITAALATASQALEKMDFHGGLEALHSVRRAYGDSEELKRVISDYEARRTAIANEALSKSIEAARAALLNNNAATALNELQGSAGLVEFAGTLQQADWRRLRTEAAKPPARRPTGTVDTGLAGTAVEELPDVTPQRRPGPRSKITALITGGVAILLAVVVAIWWLRRPTEISITQSQPGATVTIDNVQLGKIDSGGNFVAHVNPGDHHITVTLDGYRPFETGIVVNRGNRSDILANLSLIPTGTLLLQGNVNGANVLVDGVAMGTLENGKMTIKLAEGPHFVRLTKDGYEDSAESSVKIVANQQQTLPGFNIRPISATDSYVIIHSTPGRAQVSVNNVRKGATDAKGNLMVKVDPGSLQVKVESKDFNPKTQTVVVSPGDKQRVDITLERTQPLPSPKPPDTNKVAANPKPTETVNTGPSAPNPPPPPPAAPPQIVSFSATPSSIEEGQSTNLQWTTANASDVSIDHGIDTVAGTGHTLASPPADTSYTLTARGAGGVQQKTITVAVIKEATSPPLAPSPSIGTGSSLPVDESALIRAAVNRYQSAYNAHDIDKIRAAWPSLSSGTEKTMRSSFKDHPEIKQNVDCPSSPNVAGDTAQWSCRLTTTVLSSGKLQGGSTNVTFSFAKRDGNWVISTLK